MTLKSIKGSELTSAEADANFLELDNLITPTPEVGLYNWYITPPIDIGLVELPNTVYFYPEDPTNITSPLEWSVVAMEAGKRLSNIPELGIQIHTAEVEDFGVAETGGGPDAIWSFNSLSPSIYCNVSTRVYSDNVVSYEASESSTTLLMFDEPSTEAYRFVVDVPTANYANIDNQVPIPTERPNYINLLGDLTDFWVYIFDTDLTSKFSTGSTPTYGSNNLVDTGAVGYTIDTVNHRFGDGCLRMTDKGTDGLMSAVAIPYATDTSISMSVMVKVEDTGSDQVGFVIYLGEEAQRYNAQIGVEVTGGVPTITWGVHKKAQVGSTPFPSGFNTWAHVLLSYDSALAETTVYVDEVVQPVLSQIIVWNGKRLQITGDTGIVSFDQLMHYGRASTTADVASLRTLLLGYSLTVNLSFVPDTVYIGSAPELVLNEIPRPYTSTESGSGWIFFYFARIEDLYDDIEAVVTLPNTVTAPAEIFMYNYLYYTQQA